MKPGLRHLLIGALAMLAFAGSAAAQQQQQKPPSFAVPPPRLRGPEAAPQPAAPAATTPTKPTEEPQPADPGLRQALPPRPDTTARLGGLRGEQPGGALCRSACAQSYYFCLSNQGDDSCPTNWSQCLLACPTNSSPF